MIKKAMQNNNNVLDRSIFEDAIFMRMNADMGNTIQDEYEIYKQHLDNMIEEYPKFSPGKKAPDLICRYEI